MPENSKKPAEVTKLPAAGTPVSAARLSKTPRDLRKVEGDTLAAILPLYEELAVAVKSQEDLRAAFQAQHAAASDITVGVQEKFWAKMKEFFPEMDRGQQLDFRISNARDFATLEFALVVEKPAEENPPSTAA